MPTPGQAFSSEHSRVFVLVPPPQVAEHSENDDHSDHWGTNRSPSEKVVKIVQRVIRVSRSKTTGGIRLMKSNRVKGHSSISQQA